MLEHEICTTLLCVLCRRTKSVVFQSISFSMLILLFSVLFHFILFCSKPYIRSNIFFCLLVDF